MTETGQGEFPAYDRSELRRPSPSSGLSKIEEGQDSIVLRWNRGSIGDYVLKYYVNSDVDLEVLKKYAQALNRASRNFGADPFDSVLGQVNFSIVTVDKVGMVNKPSGRIAVSQSEYIEGVELESVRFSDEYLRILMESIGMDESEIYAIIRFARLWRKPDSNLQTSVLQHIRKLNVDLTAMFGTDKVGCDEINIKLTAVDRGYTLFVTDIAVSVPRFVAAISRK